MSREAPFNTTALAKVDKLLPPFSSQLHHDEKSRFTVLTPHILSILVGVTHNLLGSKAW